MSELAVYFSNNIMINCRLDSISTSEKEPKIKLNPTKRDQLLSLNQDQTLVDLETNVENVCPDPNTCLDADVENICLDTDVENICSLQILPPRDFSFGHSDCSDCSSEKVDFVGQRKIDFLESKISLLELLLDAKTIKINEQAIELSKRKEVHDTFNTSEQLAAGNEQDTTVALQLKKKQEQLIKESIELEESRIIAASFNHAESLYLNKLEQLECQIALERMGANAPTRLFPISGSVPVEQLEQTLIAIQKLLKLEPNISNEGLELLLYHLQKTLDESNQIIELQHSKLQQVLDEQNQSSAIVTSPSLVLAKELIKIIRLLSSSNDESSKMKQISLSLLQVIKKEARFLESSCLRLEDQLAINFEIKRLLVSLQVEKKNTELVVRLNDVLHENADLRQQLHISADYQNTINL